MASTFLNLSTDTTLGGNSPSDSVAVSQKAIKTYVDNNSGGGGSSYAAGTGIDITSGVISVTSPTLTNTATGTDSLSVYADESGATGTRNVVLGKNSYVGSKGGNVVIGYTAQSLGNSASTYSYNTVVGCAAHAYYYNSIVIGYSARSTGISNIQIGMGTNSTAYTLQVGFLNPNDPLNPLNYTLLDGTTGLIPYGRIPYDNSTIMVNASGQLQAAMEAFTAAEVQTIWESV